MAELKIPDDLPELTEDQVSKVAMQIIAENLRSVSGEHDRTMFVRKLAKILETERISTLTAERDALKAQVKQLSRPFSEAEVKEKWPEASLAEAGLANAMTLARIGLRAWTKDSIALTVAIDASRAAEKGPSNGRENMF